MEIESFSPIDGRIIASVSVCDNLDEVIANSQKAFLQWRKVPAPARGDFVRKIGNLFRKHKNDLAGVITLEVGKTYEEALGEVQEVIDICDFAVGLSRTIGGPTIPSERPEHLLMEQWHPLGPVGVISAFNFPMAVWAWNTMLALVCGDTVIWKPSELAPHCADKCLEIVNEVAQDSNLPDNLVSVVHGGKDVGMQLAADSRLPLISATGSVKMGKHVGAIVGGDLRRCLLELGGNNAAIVSHDADLEMTIRSIVFSAVGTTGQRCTTLRRLIVHEDIFDEVALKLELAYSQLKVGNPSDPNVHIGPLINKEAFDKMQKTLQEARLAQSRDVIGGQEVPFHGGYYVKPALVLEPNLDASFLQQETFAPILYMIPYTTLEEAIHIQNDVPQGLSSAIFTQNIGEALTFCGPEGSDCGIANVNIGTSGAEIGGAFGGEKDTGGGRESGSDSWKNYMRRATNTLNFSKDLPLSQGIKFNWQG